MIVSEPVQAAIWHCLNHYAYADAIFLAERFYAEVDSDDALFLLATCYYRAGKLASAYSVLNTKGSKTSQCRYLLARCCLDLNKMAEAEVALTGNSILRMKWPEEMSSEFGDAASFAMQLLGHVCSKTERLGKASEAFYKSLKLNPFLWSSYEALCNMGEKPDPTKIFQVTHLESLNMCHGSSVLVHLVNQGSNMVESFSNIPDVSDLTSENSVMSVQHTPFVTSTPSLGYIRSIDCHDDVTPENNAFYIPPTAPKGHRIRSGAKVYPTGILKRPIVMSPLSTSLGVCPLVETPSPNDAHQSYSVAFITPSPPALIDPQSAESKIIARKMQPNQMLIPPKPSVFSPSRNTSNTNNVNISQTPSPQSSLQPNAIPVPRRSSRLFSSSNSVKENNKSSSKARFTSPKAPTRKTKTRSPKSNITQSTYNELNELNKPETVAFENKANSVSVTQHALSILKAAAEGLMQLLQELGQAFLQLSQYNCHKAIDLFSSLSPQHSNTGWTLCNLGKAYFELAEYRKAVQLFAEVRLLEPHRTEGMEYFSTALWHLQKEVDLSYLAQELTEIDKESPEAWCATGNCFSLQKEHDTAIKFFQRAVQVDPNFAYAYTLLGHEYVITEELDKAMSCFRNAIRVDPRHYNAWYGVGMIYYKQEKFQLAEFHFKKALTINPQSSILMCHVGVVQHALQKTEMALNTLDQAITADPKNPLCKFHRASIYFANDRHQDALRELNELKEIVPKESLVYFLIGKVHKKLGNTHLALMNFSWAMDLDPKGANNQIKEAIDRRYAYDDDELSASNETLPEEVIETLVEYRQLPQDNSIMDTEEVQLQANEGDESL